MPSIEDLIPDIHDLFVKTGHKISPENMEQFIKDTVDSVTQALEQPQTVHPKGELRMSKLGTPLRKLWFEHNLEIEPVKDTSEVPDDVGSNLFRFLIGHVTEALLLFLAKEAGHTVEYEQHEIVVEGVPGHNDAVIDGHMSDVKTASQFGFAKFEDGNIFNDDPFGYLDQLGCYTKGLEAQEDIILDNTSYLWAYNKSNSEMTLTPVNRSTMLDPVKHIKNVKKVISKPNPPVNKCYPAKPYGKSGNFTINKNCNYCPFKFECWKSANNGKGLRTFRYSNGDVHFTDIVNEPKVQEIKNGIT